MFNWYLLPWLMAASWLILKLLGCLLSGGVDPRHHASLMLMYIAEDSPVPTLEDHILPPCTGTLGNGSAWFTVSEICDSLNSGVSHGSSGQSTSVFTRSWCSRGLGSAVAFILGPSSFYYNNLNYFWSLFSASVEMDHPLVTGCVGLILWPLLTSHCPWLPTTTIPNCTSGFNPSQGYCLPPPALTLDIPYYSQPPHALCMAGL